MRHLLPLLPRPSRYLGSEDGSLRTPPDPCRAHMALAFPDLYEVGMSYTGQAILLHTVNNLSGFFAERVFAPDDDAGAILSAHKAPLTTLETGTPLAHCDVVGFHLTHELCATTMLWMLDLAGIPRRTEARENGPPLQTATDSPADASGAWPLILGGGGITCNAEFLAPFLDAMVLGDGEAVLPELLEVVAHCKEQGRTRKELLQTLATIPGVYVPTVYDAAHDSSRPNSIGRAIVPDLNAINYPLRSPQAFGAVHDRYTIEIARGCTRGCRFCHAGMIYRPVRERSLETLQGIVEQGIENSGYEELSFLSLSTGDFSALEQLFDQSLPRCRAEQVAISLPSLRVGSVSPGVMAKIAGLRRTGVTLAPEAGSQRLRDVINKGITEEALLEHCRKLFALGWDQVKLYFMIGLPTETQADLDAIVELCKKVEALGKAVKGKPGRLQITAGVSTFVPKPHTPFQWERQLSLEETRERIGYLRAQFRNHRRLVMRFHLPEMSWLEGVFSRGDRRLADALDAATDAGIRFDSWTDRLDIAAWNEVFAQCGIDANAYLDAREPRAQLPWDHLNPGVRKGFLLAERRRAMAGRRTEDCRFGRCYQCGACVEDPAHVLNQQERDQEVKEIEEDFSISPPFSKPAKTALGEKAAQLRLWYEKTGPAAYLSQRELSQIFERAFRRARLPLSFSQGFHPTPRISFAPALPVGVESLRERIDIWLRESLSPETVQSRLQGHFPAGITLSEVVDLGLKKPPPDPTREQYQVHLINPARDARAVRAAVQDFLQLETSTVTLPGKKGERHIDVRSRVAAITQDDEASLHFLMDWTTGYVNPLAIIRHAISRPEQTLGLDAFRIIKIGSIEHP